MAVLWEKQTGGISTHQNRRYAWIEQKEQTKDLGIYIDNKLSWAAHCDGLGCTVANKVVWCGI